jgi:hypothetical protein
MRDLKSHVTVDFRAHDARERVRAQLEKKWKTGKLEKTGKHCHDSEKESC